ncbi:MAG TPA: cytochrome c oxidase accessory protein CcoG [Longimicrobiales bacterium]
MLGFSGSREWVYVQWIRGKYQRRRHFTFAVLHLILFLTPWLIISGHPVLRFDLEARRLFAFGAVFTAADTILLLLLLLFLAFSLFFFTSLYGRLWCGFGCPQTVMLDTWVRPIERWIEGERTTRQRRDAGPWTLDKAWRKALKWSVYLLAAIVVAMSFMSFFAGARELWTGRGGTVEYALVGIIAAGWFADFVWFREQFCNYLCPYARFQSALVDPHTLLIAYDPKRGEPRGGKTAKTEGRCLACEKCAAVCPQGIDIRNGFQLECIACARCVDACTGVMQKVGHESLISYTTNAEQHGRQPRRIQPRTVAYAAMLTGIAAVAVLMLATRTPFEVSVARIPGSLYSVDPDGYVRNTYMLRIANNDAIADAARFNVAVEGLESAEVVVPEIALASMESRMIPLVVRVPVTSAIDRTYPMRVRVTTAIGERVVETTFKSGARNGGGS